MEEEDQKVKLRSYSTILAIYPVPQPPSATSQILLSLSPENLKSGSTVEMDFNLGLSIVNCHSIV